MLQTVRRRLEALDPATLLFLLAVALIAAGVLKDLALLAVGRDRELSNLLAFLTLRSGTDSWAPMHAAVELFRSDRAAGIYQTVFFAEQTKFQYPPTSLLPFVALGSLGLGRDGLIGLMQLITFAGVIGIVAVTTKLVLDQRDLPGLKPALATPLATWLVLAAVAAGTLSFDPIMYAYEVGQIQVLIDLAVGGALLCQLKGRPRAAGAVMALAALVKPQYGLVLVWSILRREHRFSIGFLATAAPIGLISLLVFGIAEHFSYLSVIGYIGRHGELFWANQSVNGLLNRLVHDADAMTWNARAFAPFHPLVYAGTLASTLAFLLFGLGFRPRWTRRADAGGPAAAIVRQERTLDLATMILALTLASPIAWEHHYGIAWPAMVLALVALVGLRARRSDRLVGAVAIGLGASYWLISNYLTQIFPAAGTPFSVLQSYTFFGGLMLLATLSGLRAGLDPDAGGSATPAAEPR
jgi:hypothetical protein